MLKSKIIELLKDHNPEQVEKFAAYVTRLFQEKKDGKPKNYWLQSRKEEEMADLFKRVARDGLVFDGVHITLQSTGISYDYVAFKNKMLLAYPDSKIDVQLVYEGDEFSVAKESGSVVYSHSIKNPLSQDPKQITGGYCVIQNKRGEFITLLSKDDIARHRKVAKTDFIWQAWPKEMALKTVIKKACKQHFDDIYEGINELDNGNYDLDNPIDVELKHKQAIEKIDKLADLTDYWRENQGSGKGFDLLIKARREQLNQKTD